MDKIVMFQLTANEAGQVIDGLEVRAEAYERTASYLKGVDETGEFFLIEEVNDAEEAEKLAAVYRGIIDSMTRQLEKAQAPISPSG